MQKSSPNLEILGSNGCSTLALWYPKTFLFSPKIKCNFTHNPQLTFFPQSSCFFPLIVTNKKKVKLDLVMVWLLLKAHYLVTFQPLLAALSARVLYALSHASHNDISKNKGINFVLSRIWTHTPEIPRSKHNQFNQIMFVLIPQIL